MEVTENEQPGGDHVEIRIGSGGRNIAAGKNIVQIVLSSEQRSKLTERVERNLQLLTDSPLDDFQARLGNYLRSLFEHEQLQLVIRQILDEGKAEVAEYEQTLLSLAQDSHEAAKELRQRLVKEDYPQASDLMQELERYDPTRAIESLLADASDEQIENDFTPYANFWQHIAHQLEKANVVPQNGDELGKKVWGDGYTRYKEQRLRYQKQLRVRSWGSLIRLLAWADWLGYERPVKFNLPQSWLLQRELEQIREKKQREVDTLRFWAESYPRAVDSSLRQRAETLRERVLSDARNLANEILNKLEIDGVG
jgi:hypothetical protein